MIDGWKKGQCKRSVDDKLLKIRLELKKFIDSYNDDCNKLSETDDGEKPLLNGTMLQQQVQLARDMLLQQQEADPTKGVLTPEEVVAFTKFKASLGWARKAALQCGWRMVDERNPTNKEEVEAPARPEGEGHTGGVDKEGAEGGGVTVDEKLAAVKGGERNDDAMTSEGGGEEIVGKTAIADPVNHDGGIEVVNVDVGSGENDADNDPVTVERDFVDDVIESVITSPMML